MEDVPVEQDSEQKIMVWEVQYMAMIAEAVKNWVTKHMSKTDKRKELEAGCVKMVKTLLLRGMLWSSRLCARLLTCTQKELSTLLRATRSLT